MSDLKGCFNIFKGENVVLPINDVTMIPCIVVERNTLTHPADRYTANIISNVDQLHDIIQDRSSVASHGIYILFLIPHNSSMLISSFSLNHQYLKNDDESVRCLMDILSSDSKDNTSHVYKLLRLHYLVKPEPVLNITDRVDGLVKYSIQARYQNTSNFWTYLDLNDSNLGIPNNFPTYPAYVPAQSIKRTNLAIQFTDIVRSELINLTLDRILK